MRKKQTSEKQSEIVAGGAMFLLPMKARAWNS
jgi:hypothetical protein